MVISVATGRRVRDGAKPCKGRQNDEDVKRQRAHESVLPVHIATNIYMNNMTNESLVAFRILCLHNGNSSAKELNARLQSLDERLHQKHNVELVYVNSPLRDAKEGLVWWEKADGTDEEYSGLDATLLYLKQVLSSMPFSGVLAVGHCAALAAFLPFMANSLEFGIFVHGSSLLKEEERLIEDWPVLHIIGTRMQEIGTKNPVSRTISPLTRSLTLPNFTDPNLDSNQRLIDQFGGNVHESTDPLDLNDLNVIGKVCEMMLVVQVFPA